MKSQMRVRLSSITPTLKRATQIHVFLHSLSLIPILLLPTLEQTLSVLERHRDSTIEIKRKTAILWASNRPRPVQSKAELAAQEHLHHTLGYVGMPKEMPWHFI